MMCETRGKFYNYKGNKKKSYSIVIDQGFKPHWFGLDELTNPNSESKKLQWSNMDEHDTVIINYN